jgi:transposase
MILHADAALSWAGRRRLCEFVVDQGWTVMAAAAAAGVSVGCARKWVARYRLEGEAGLSDRSSAPRRVASRTAEERIAVIVKLRRLRFTVTRWRAPPRRRQEARSDRPFGPPGDRQPP